MRESWVQSLGQEDPLEKEMATHSSILAWRIPWTEEPGGIQSMGFYPEDDLQKRDYQARAQMLCLRGLTASRQGKPPRLPQRGITQRHRKAQTGLRTRSGHAGPWGRGSYSRPGWDGRGAWGGGAAYLSRKVAVSMTMLLERVKVSAVTRTRTGR